jgi:C4-dicarboxylate-specific signal transduction histidine kinase
VTAPSESVQREQLSYFASVSASISHELSNVLAVLNEDAGLLQDLAAMAAQGRPLDPQQIGRLAATMLKQVRRGDDIVKRMNRFAHSVDREQAPVDLGALAGLVADLFGRSAAMRGVTIEVHGSAAPITLNTQPFVLETLLGKLLDRLSAGLADGGVLRIGLHAQDLSAQIRMAGAAPHSAALAGLPGAADVAALLALLQANALFEPDSGELVITLPGVRDT